MCVLDKGGVEDYKKFHDLLYANQPPENTAGPEDAALIDYAKQVGVTGIDSLHQARRSTVRGSRRPTRRRSRTGSKARLGVRIDGKDVKSPTPAELQKAIDAAKKS